jgi:hypothetical protein
MNKTKFSELPPNCSQSSAFFIKRIHFNKVIPHCQSNFHQSSLEQHEKLWSWVESTDLDRKGILKQTTSAYQRKPNLKYRALTNIKT